MKIRNQPAFVLSFTPVESRYIELLNCTMLFSYLVCPSVSWHVTYYMLDSYLVCPSVSWPPLVLATAGVTECQLSDHQQTSHRSRGQAPAWLRPGSGSPHITAEWSDSVCRQNGFNQTHWLLTRLATRYAHCKSKQSNFSQLKWI